MKRFFSLFLFLSFLSLFASCDTSREVSIDTAEPPPSIDELVSEPPVLMIEDGEQTITLRSGNGEWAYHIGNGKWASSNFCGAHPLDNVHTPDPVPLSDNPVTLSFDLLPDSVTVLCWPDTDLGNTESSPSEVPVTNFTFSSKPGSWIYEITARWEQSDNRNYHGHASYAFYAVFQ